MVRLLEEQERKTNMHHRMFLSCHCFLLFSAYLSLFYDFSMRSLEIGSLNINGGRDRQKKTLISEVSNHKNIHVLFLLETHTNTSDETDWGLWWKGSYNLSHGTNFSAGVAVLFKVNTNETILTCTVKGRLLIVWARIDYNL